MNWYLGVWKKYATFGGRARRAEYWYFFLFNMIAVFVLSFVDAFIGAANDSGYGPLYSLYALAVFLPALAVGVRRMHDSDHSGWWIIVPLVNLVFALSEGTRGPNRFGPDPKGQEHAHSASTPAGWYPDPSGRNQYRYWDSVLWTASVANNGVNSTDPM